MRGGMQVRKRKEGGRKEGCQARREDRFKEGREKLKVGWRDERRKR